MERISDAASDVSSFVGDLSRALSAGADVFGAGLSAGAALLNDIGWNSLTVSAGTRTDPAPRLTTARACW